MATALLLVFVHHSLYTCCTCFAVGGSPLAGAGVEACEGSGAAAVVLDSSVTDASGQYRIGNLKPGVTYTIRVRLDGRVTSAHPASVQV